MLITVFLVLIIGVGYFLSYYYNNEGILIIALIFSIGSSISSYWFSDKIVLAMCRAIPVKREEYFDLYNIVENLSITAGLPMPKVYIIEEKAPNAFATGRDPKHAVVAVTRGLLNKLDRTELEGVIAHEMSHIGNRDILISTVIVVLAGIVVTASNIFFHMGFGGKRDRERSGGILIIIGIVAMILAPIAATLIKLAISRKREFLADASGALLTRYPEGLASALIKISSDPTPMKVANNATAHLWLDDPFKAEQKTSFFHKIFMTHPPIEERIKALRDIPA
ncbi:MAG: M48 family metallopeptidase [Candidatus Pacebacteria bacterium]|nr:M48 family metallopeptidase [Candidatus Paceibacterota bacterium]